MESPRPSGVSLNAYLTDVEAAVADLGHRGVAGRIWKRDHTVWKPDPAEITNRLGWLAVLDAMREQAPALERFAQEVRGDGFRSVVLLGMGGSSLGPEVLRQTFGSTAGYPELIVLDSTVPGEVKAVTEAIDPAHTLFLVSSKSGSTIEVVCLELYFRSLVEQAVGKERARRSFVTITDPGTQLAKRAQDGQFRCAFENPPDIGGRYSVLSYFGLVPAALMGISLSELLECAERMRNECRGHEAIQDNPGAWLGAVMGTLACRGRDKLTLVTSQAISGFGLWVEQLVAESTGKEGKGVIPVVGEPLMSPSHYGDDRLFVCLRLECDDNAAVDMALANIESAGQPVLVLEMQDKSELGAEFFRWEFATAVAGAVLGVHPFDQPNVQEAKSATGRVLEEYTASGRLPQVQIADSLAELVAQAENGTYLAITAYVRQDAETDSVLAGLRKAAMERHHIASTLGYGPRYLHSTGQLHKGGPRTGLFFQITTGHEYDIPIPGKPYTFGVLADSQALGDLQALQSSGRPVAGVRLDGGREAAMSRLAGLLPS